MNKIANIFDKIEGTFDKRMAMSVYWWVVIWILLVLFLALSLACRSIVLFLLTFTLALLVGMMQCSFAKAPPPKRREIETPFGGGKERVEPELRYPEDTNLAAIKCATRGTEEDGWITGYEGPEKWCDEERYLRDIAVQSLETSQEETIPNMLPRASECPNTPPPCPLRIAWEPTFIGCSSTFIEAPEVTCDLYCKDERLWHRDLDKLYQERAVISGAEWDVYKHFQSRQKMAQFLSEDMINRKSFYEKPIQNLEEASCFAKTVKC